MSHRRRLDVSAGRKRRAAGPRFSRSSHVSPVRRGTLPPPPDRSGDSTPAGTSREAAGIGPALPNPYNVVGTIKRGDNMDTRMIAIAALVLVVIVILAIWVI
jgi:hypothetical protein